MTQINDILKVVDILDIDDEYKQYVEYTLSKNKKPTDLKTYKLLKNKIIKELRKHE